MKYLILIAGLPGTGKTSFANYLGKKMNIPIVSKDILKEHLFDTIGFKNRQEKVALGIAACDILYHFADRVLESGQPAILENNFEIISKPGLERLIATHRCPTILVRFYADIKVLGERFRIRDCSPERHRGHVVNTQYPEPEDTPITQPPPFDPERYYSDMKKRGVDVFTVGGEELSVDTTDFSRVSYEELYREILARVKKLTQAA